MRPVERVRARSERCADSLRRLWPPIAFALALAALSPACAQECVRVGSWALPRAQGASEILERELLERVAARPVVLLGESHERVEHHRWQLQTIAALHGQRSAMVLGFEMFPRRVQPILDRWVAGQLSESDFLEKSEWTRVWGFEAAYYLPMFHFARMNRIPMIALNVERDLIREIGRKGADAVAAGMREGVGRPEPATRDYLRELHAVFLQHGESKGAGLEDPQFLRFVDSQLTWDRAMAEGIQHARQAFPGRQVVGIMGRGHTAPGAVPHQLRALGVQQTAVLLPWERGADCAQLQSGIADAVFGVDSAGTGKSAAPRPRLGVVLSSNADTGVRIDRVSERSVAAAAGLRAGDVFIQVAGREVKDSADVVAAVARQAPGTWLPIRVRRDGSELELIAKFPAR